MERQSESSSTDARQRLPIGVGVLSWRAPKTVANTLAQYGDFPALFDEFRLFFQECTDADRRVARQFGVDFAERPTNVGIQDGMRWVAESLKGEYILYLENDFNLIVPPEEAFRELVRAREWIGSGRVDIVRLRSLFNPGLPCTDPHKYSTFYRPRNADPRFQLGAQLADANPLLRWLRPFKARRIAARGAYVEREPEKLFPRVFRREPEGLVTTSAYLNWTNNPVLIRRKLFLRIADYADAHPSHRTVGGFQDFEKPLNCRWWRAQKFRIGLPDGIFTHNRLDR